MFHFVHSILQPLNTTKHGQECKYQPLDVNKLYENRSAFNLPTINVRKLTPQKQQKKRTTAFQTLGLI